MAKVAFGAFALRAAVALAGFAAAAGFEAAVFFTAVAVALVAAVLAAAGFLAVFAAAGAAVAFAFTGADFAFVAAFAGAADFLGAAGFAADFETDFFKFCDAFLAEVEAAAFAGFLAAAGACFALTGFVLDATEVLEEVLTLEVAARDRPAVPDFFGGAAGFDEVAVAFVGLAFVFTGPAFAADFVFAAI